VAASLLVGGAGLAAVASGASALLLGPLGGRERIGRASDLRGPELESAVEAMRPGNVPTDTPWWLAVDAAHTTTPPDLLHTTGTALAVLGLALLVVPLAPRLLAPLAAAGSMPLSLYSVHLLVLHVVDDADPLLLWATQAVAALVLAALWRRYVGRGPLEALTTLVTAPIRGRSRT
jgi:hypothetical protein